MNEVEVSNKIDKINTLLSHISPEQAVDIVKDIIGFAREKEVTKRYEAWRDVTIIKILADYKQHREDVDKVFSERKAILEKAFESIDKGLESKDFNALQVGLSAIGLVIKENPFQNLQNTTAEQRQKMWENGEFSIE